MIKFINELDTALFFVMNSDREFPIIDAFFVTITDRYFLAEVFVAICVLFFLAFRKEFIIYFLFLAAGVGILDFTGATIKDNFTLPRPSHPEYFLEGGNFLTDMRRSGSFPSNHALNWGFTGFYLFLFLRLKKKYRHAGLFFLSFGALISYSRVYVGVHFPSDVIFGFLAGSLTAYLFINISRRVEMAISKTRKENIA